MLPVTTSVKFTGLERLATALVLDSTAQGHATSGRRLAGKKTKRRSPNKNNSDDTVVFITVHTALPADFNFANSTSSLVYLACFMLTNM